MEPGCVQQLLVQLEQSLCMSTMVTTQQGLTEDQAGQGQGDSDHIILAEHALVPHSSPHVNEQATMDSQGGGTASTKEQPPHPQEEPHVGINGMEYQ